jgi:hypothetical protein
MFSGKLQGPRPLLVSTGRSAQSTRARNQMICQQMACHLLHQSRVWGERQLSEFWRRRFTRISPKRNLLVLLLIGFCTDIACCGVWCLGSWCSDGFHRFLRRQQLLRGSGPGFGFDYSCMQAQQRAEQKKQEQNAYSLGVRYSWNRANILD